MRFIGIIAWLAAAGVLGAATLSNPRRVGTDFEFSIVGESNSIYAIESSGNLQNWTRVATNRQFGQVRMITVPSNAEQEFYRVRILQPLFTGAFAVRESLNFAGSGVTVNSFDSGDPNYSGPGGVYDPIKFRDRGDIITSSGLTNSLNLGNAKVWGVLHTPPGGTAAPGPGGAVGSIAWIYSGQFGIEPGHFVEEPARVFVDPELPTGQVYVTPGPGSIGGTNYTYVLSNGHYMLHQLLSGSMVITGRATLYVSTSFRTPVKIVILRDASLDLYVGAADASLEASRVVNESGNATAFAYYGLPNNVSLSVGTYGSFVGTIYAPSADIRFSGGGNDVMDVLGAVVGRNITVFGHLNAHYDERLRVAGPAW